jgi:hypothetical protein
MEVRTKKTCEWRSKPETEAEAVTESTVCNGSTLVINGGLFENVDSDEPLSQQI